VRTKATIAVLVLVVTFYAVLIGAKGVGLLASGSLVGQALGVALLVLPLLGLLLVWREIEFGRRTAALARELDAEGGLPVDDLPRRPSGRVDRGAADAQFRAMRSEAEADPDDWRVWFRLALAYDTAGDRTRARAAARHALALKG
jgi:cytochrome c-type biogenesis protein CcmH/NrfG